MHYIAKYYIDLITKYHGNTSLIVFLKEFYKKNKQLGKRDRNALTQACFSFFRTVATENESEYYPLKLIVKQQEKEGWSYWKFLMENRIKEEDLETVIEAKKQWSNRLLSDFNFSESFDETKFKALLQTQPKVFFRDLAGKELAFEGLEKEYTLTFNDTSLQIYRVKEDTKLETILEENSYVIQDLSSQKVLIEGLKAISEDQGKSTSETVWDACAGAGGKTMLLQQIWEADKLYASDIRPEILEELKSRQERLEFKKTNVFSVDLSRSIVKKVAPQDIIIMDVPCSGSGTWGRSPEKKVFFTKNELGNWQKKQLEIMQNASEVLKENGYLLYMTCSVFREENEDLIQKFITHNPKFESIKSELIVGLDEQADTLYFNVLKSK